MNFRQSQLLMERAWRKVSWGARGMWGLLSHPLTCPTKSRTTFSDSWINLQGKIFLFNSCKSPFLICNYNFIIEHCVPGTIQSFFCAVIYLIFIIAVWDGVYLTYKLKIRHIATLQCSKRIQRHRAYENHQHSTQSVVLFFSVSL